MTGSRAIVALGLIVSAGAVSLHAQRLPYGQGDRVRVALRDSQAAGAWRTGVVWQAERDHVILRIGGQTPVEYVPFSGSLRIQVQQGRHSKSKLGAVAGGVAGAVLGATILRSSLAVWRLGETEAAATGAVLYGFIGGALGGLVGKGIGPAKWVDVPVVNGRVPVAPLTVPRVDQRPFTALNRWDRFPPTVPDFEAFFRAHADSLDPLEGLWARVGTFNRMAIVRDPDLEGYAYAGFVVSLRADRTLSRAYGLLDKVFTKPDSGGFLEARFAHGARRVPTELHAGVLTLRPIGGQPQRWVRTVP